MPFQDPQSFTSPLRRLARSLCSAEAVVAAPLPLPESQVGQPRYSVERAITALGGRRVEGWRLQEWPGVALSARHAVAWQDGEGRLWNVQDDEAYWLFVPDAALNPAGRPPLPRFQGLRRDALVDDFIAVSEQAARCRPGSDEAAVMNLTVERLSGLLEMGARGDADCPCGSGRRYARCCSRRLRDSLGQA